MDSTFAHLQVYQVAKLHGSTNGNLAVVGSSICSRNFIINSIISSGEIQIKRLPSRELLFLLN